MVQILEMIHRTMQSQIKQTTPQNKYNRLRFSFGIARRLWLLGLPCNLTPYA